MPRLVAALALMLGLAAPAVAQVPPIEVSLLPPELILKCGSTINDPARTQNFFPFVGSSGLNAQTANGRLAAGLTAEGTITVLRWPSPSSYDQVKHFSPDANLPRGGAAANEGIYLGLDIGGEVHWLRDLASRQRFTSTRSDEIRTVHRGLGLRVAVRTVIAPGRDVLAQRVRVQRTSAGAALPRRLVVFENLSLVVSNVPSAFIADWCTEELNTDDAHYDATADAIVHEKAGIDQATGEPQSVAVALGFRRRSAGHRVGGEDGTGDGEAFSGQTIGTLQAPLRFRRGRARVELRIGAAHAGEDALALVRAAPAQRRLARAKRARLDRLLAAAPLPRTRDRRMLAIARRTLILLATTAAETGAIVASISTQPPYAEDWPRDGAFFNEALSVAGLHDLVDRHERFYMRTQATETFQPRGAVALPPGNWGMNYYENGTVAGPIPYEIDETGFAAWGLWRHYEHTRDRAYLADAYPTIRRAADFLVTCRDPSNALQCTAFEDDDPSPKQTITGAVPVRLGLWSAERAARTLGHAADAERFATRRAELERAIDEHLYDAGCGCWQPDHTFSKFVAYPLWPRPLKPLSDARMHTHAEHLWRLVSPSFEAPGGDRKWHAYEAMSLLALARIYRKEGKLPRLRRGLRWLAHTVATPDTGILGENWRVHEGRVHTMTAMPQIWEHVLFYLSAIEVYGRGQTWARAR